MTLWMETLLRLVPLVEQKLAEAKAEAGEYSSAGYDAWRQRNRAADAKLIAFFTLAHSARFTESGAHEHTVKMAGLRSSSTGGWTGALQNWKTAALKKIEAADDVINLQGSGPAPIEPRQEAMRKLGCLEARKFS